MNLLLEQLQLIESDLDRLDELFKEPEFRSAMSGRFTRSLSGLTADADALRTLSAAGDPACWEALGRLQRRRQTLAEEAQEFLGGVALQRNEFFGSVANDALRLATDYARRTGVEWTPVVTVGDWGSEPPGGAPPGEPTTADAFVRIPIGAWDEWWLPLTAYAHGQWVAKRGQLAGLDEVAVAGPPGGPATRTEPGTARAPLLLLVSDALAAYLAGPAYAYALLFLEADPNAPTASEGDAPSWAERMGVVRQTLEAINDGARADRHSPGPFAADLSLLDETWRDALEAAGTLDQVRAGDAAVAGWAASIQPLVRRSFGALADETVRQWKAAVDLAPTWFFEEADPGAQADPGRCIAAAWWCRARYPERLAEWGPRYRRLLRHPPLPGGSAAEPLVSGGAAASLLNSRYHDLSANLQRLGRLVVAAGAEPANRQVAGRLNRLLSRKDYARRKLRRAAGGGLGAKALLAGLADHTRGRETHEIHREFVDLLGGLLLRYEGHDAGICAIAEALLRQYASLGGVSWTSRVVMGRNPLFSPAVGLVQIRFPEVEIWSLPLLAHEFGHVTALATPDFRLLLDSLPSAMARQHPQADTWNDREFDRHVARRAIHLHEFFADAFAVYCQGPAFAYVAVALNFNPLEAHRPRGAHPSHAERVEVIRRVMEAMNADAKADPFDPGPYADVLGRIDSWWRTGLPEAQLSPVERWQLTNAATVAGKLYDVLETEYRLGARLPASDWRRVNEIARTLLDERPALRGESLRDLLNVAWAARTMFPERRGEVGSLIRGVCERRAARPAPD